MSRKDGLAPHADAIDTAIRIATRIMTDGCARHRTSPEDNTGPGNATGRIADILAVHDGLGRRWIEGETCPTLAQIVIKTDTMDVHNSVILCIRVFLRI